MPLEWQKRDKNFVEIILVLLLFALVIFCTLSVSGHLLIFLYLPAHFSKWKRVLNLHSWNFSCLSLSICLLSHFSTVIPSFTRTRTGHIYLFISSLDIYVQINTAVGKFNTSCIRYPFRTKVQPYLKTTHVRMCDKGLHMYKGMQPGGSPGNTLVWLLPGPSQKPSAFLHNLLHKGRRKPIGTLKGTLFQPLQGCPKSLSLGTKPTTMRQFGVSIILTFDARGRQMQYRAEEKSILWLQRAYKTFRRGAKGRERDGSRWPGEELVSEKICSVCVCVGG